MLSLTKMQLANCTVNASHHQNKTTCKTMLILITQSLCTLLQNMYDAHNYPPKKEKKWSDALWQCSDQRKL